MLYSNMDNIDIVVTLLKKHEIKDLIISPGGTNIAIVKKVQNDIFFNCYSVIDERSAAYVAIGMYLQRRRPIVIICTSAQATRNYIPGLTEAFYKKVPILAITMEKHPRFKYQEYMQAPDQTSLPKDSVKNSFELPFISDINDYYHSMRLTNDAILELSKNGLGPVQLCVPWLDFSLAERKPSIRTIKRFYTEEINKEDLSNKKILVLIGEHTPFSQEEIRAIDHFCFKTNSVIYVNHLSNFQNDYSINGNFFLLVSNCKEINEIKPDILITIGGQSGDYPFYTAFSNNLLDEMEHWRVCVEGDVVDTYDKLTRIYQGTIIDFFDSVKSECINHSYFESWKNKIDSKNPFIRVPFSQVAIAQYLHDKLPHNSIIQFSILNSLRIWNFFSIDPSIECYSNVGAFGIDGGLSTLIGQSIVTDKLCFMIIGDLAFFYDMNSLGIRDIKSNVRILLVNNNGGIEFKLHGENKIEQDKFIAAANYHGLAQGWSESCDFEYYSAKNLDEFIKIVPKFISKSKKSIILEVFLSDIDESAAYLGLVNENKKLSIKDNTKECIKKVIKKFF